MKISGGLFFFEVNSRGKVFAPLQFRYRLAKGPLLVNDAEVVGAEHLHVLQVA